MEKMLLFLIFFLISMSDTTTPRKSSHVTKTESQVTPTANPTFTSSALPLQGLNNGTKANELSKLDLDRLLENSNISSSPTTKRSGDFSREHGTLPNLQNVKLHEHVQSQKPTESTNPTSSSSEWKQQSNVNLDGETSQLFLKLDRKYTPMEIAEYIFVTGDEKGFTQGVSEMMEDGQIMISGDDVILFLEAVQQELAKLRRESGSVQGNGI